MPPHRAVFEKHLLLPKSYEFSFQWVVHNSPSPATISPCNFSKTNFETLALNIHIERELYWVRGVNYGYQRRKSKYYIHIKNRMK